jgi:hypothetical protein
MSEFSASRNWIEQHVFASAHCPLHDGRTAHIEIVAMEW